MLLIIAEQGEGSRPGATLLVPSRAPVAVHIHAVSTTSAKPLNAQARLKALPFIVPLNLDWRCGGTGIMQFLEAAVLKQQQLTPALEPGEEKRACQVHLAALAWSTARSWHSVTSH